MNKSLKQFFLYSKLLILVIKVDYLLLTKGFNKTFQIFSTKYFSSKTAIVDEISSKKAEEILHLFSTLDIVCAWYPRKADCIHKTLIGYQLIRQIYELPVEMVVGIRKFPFEAHAWLIHNGMDLFETEATSQYKIIYYSSKFTTEATNDLVSANN